MPGLFRALALGALVLVLGARSAEAADPVSPEAPGAAELTLKIPNLLDSGKKLTTPQEKGELVAALEILALMTVLTLAPAILMMTTAFTRIVIVLSFLRRALATQQLPPNQVIVGMSLFLTFLVMAPTWGEINEKALQPYLNGQVTQGEAWKRARLPMRGFMFRQVERNGWDDLWLFIRLAKMKVPAQGVPSRESIPTHILVSSFVLGEMRVAFEMGFLLYLPFLVIDMVVASVLMSMGMMMLPPIVISLPFKLLLFVLGDGWRLVVGGLVQSFG